MITRLTKEEEKLIREQAENYPLVYVQSLLNEIDYLRKEIALNQYIKDLNCGITNKSSDWVFFWASSSDSITEEMAEEIQNKLGYSPMGYGIYDFQCVLSETEGWRATWKCQRSCD